MKFNNEFQNIRHVLSGKDGAVFNADGDLMATVTQFAAAVNITNATYNPLGSALTQKHLLSYEVTLTLTETVIETGEFLRALYETFQTGVPSYFTFQTVMRGYDDTEERLVFRDCVPDGNLNLQSANVGEIWTREITLAVNSPPELQKILTYAR